MTELVIVISILGVLAGITVVPMNQFLTGGKDVMAATRQEMLNQAVYRFAQQNYELQFNRMDASLADELVILRSLQYRDPNINRAMIGSPYVDPRYNPVSSSNVSEYRLRWTGKMYELLSPGQSGTGILMDFDGADFTTAFVFPPNFQMAGR
jgi:type II secretory pathway pseudopilin PulG